MMIDTKEGQENSLNNTHQPAVNNRLFENLDVDLKPRPPVHIEYLTTPGSQPFPAWPGLLQSWYETNVLPWSIWNQQQSNFRLQYDNQVIEEEQDSPLDLTVQAK